MRVCQLKYVGKSRIPFNIRFNNHRKDAKSQASILACKHFNKQNQNFQQPAEFTLIEQIRKQTTTKETITLLLLHSSTVHIYPTKHSQQTEMINKI